MTIGTSAAAFVAALPLARYSGNPVIGTSSPIWTGYAGEPTILPNPLNPSQLLLFYSNGGGVHRAVGSASNPYSWTQHTWVFGPTNAGTWDGRFVRKANVWAEGTTLYMSYNGDNSGTGWLDEKMGIASSTDAGLTWTRYAGNPTKTPSGTFGGLPVVSVMLGNISKIGDTYYLVYVSVTSPTSSATARNMTYATSSSKYGPWTDSGVSLLPPGVWEYHQEHQFNDGTWMMTYEYPTDPNNPDSSTYPYVDGLAFSPAFTTPYTPYSGNPFFTGSHIAGTWDQNSVATPGWGIIGGKWYFFYQGGPNVRATTNTWQLGMASTEFIDPVAGGTTTTIAPGTTSTTTTSAPTTTTTTAGPTTTSGPSGPTAPVLTITPGLGKITVSLASGAVGAISFTADWVTAAYAQADKYWAWDDWGNAVTLPFDIPCTEAMEGFVRAINASGDTSVWFSGSPFAATTTTAAPLTPTAPTISVTLNDRTATVNLVSGGVGATSFTLYTFSGNTTYPGWLQDTSQFNISAFPYTFAGLTYGEAFTVWAVAHNAYGDSSQSAMITVTPVAAATTTAAPGSSLPTATLTVIVTDNATGTTTAPATTTTKAPATTTTKAPATTTTTSAPLPGGVGFATSTGGVAWYSPTPGGALEIMTPSGIVSLRLVSAPGAVEIQTSTGRMSIA